MHQQKIKVNTKGGLLSAFECAKSVHMPTIIILVTKSKEIIFVLHYSKSILSILEYNKSIERAKRNIRRIPAKDLLR